MTGEPAPSPGRGLLWIASYPKSGNTWMRAFLTAYLRDAPVTDLDDLVGSIDHDRVDRLDDDIGLDPAELTLAQLDHVRRREYVRAHATAERLLVRKTHLANRELAGGGRLFDAATGRAVYLVRHPLDVVDSYRAFLATTESAVIQAMENDDAVLDRHGERPLPLAPQPMGSWSSHVRSWVRGPGPERCIVRYEDLLADPEHEFGRVVRFAGLGTDPGRLRRAVDAAGFDRLAALERTSPMSWRPASAERFFRRGRAGDDVARRSRPVPPGLDRPLVRSLGYDLPDEI